MVKIAIISPNTGTGEGRYGEYLIDGLKERGIDVEILQSSFFNRPNIKIFLGSFLLRKLVRDKNVSILHNLDNLGPFLIKNNSELKTVQTVFDISPVILPEIHNSIIKFNFKTILPRLIKNSDSVIVSSNSTKKDLICHFGINENKINNIQLGIDTSFFYPRMHNKDILKKYGIKNKFLLYVGNDNPRKNLKNLIIAYNMIYNKIEQDLLLVGPINEKKIINFIKTNDKLKGSKKLLNRIIIPGYISHEDLPILYSAASALVFPSLYEGFGFPPLEAMACGTPVITSNNSSLKEIVGEAALLINDPLNPKEISEKIFDILDENKLHKKLKTRGFRQAKKFSWDKTVERTIGVYDNLI